MTVAAAVFLLSLVGIIALFVVKHRERSREALYAPRLRARLDDSARFLKARLVALEAEAEKIPPRAVAAGHFLLHDAAILVGHAGRALERKAFGLADMISHRHRFEKKEPRSDFLKRVNEAKNGKDTSMDSVLEE
jgi:hypothetical protein